MLDSKREIQIASTNQGESIEFYAFRNWKEAPIECYALQRVYRYLLIVCTMARVDSAKPHGIVNVHHKKSH